LFAVGAVDAEFHVQTPRREAFADLRRVGIQRQFARRGDDAHGVAAVQVGRADELRGVGFLSSGKGRSEQEQYRD